MSHDEAGHRPRRPAMLSPGAMDAFAQERLDPAVITQVAHETAAVIVGTGRAADDPQLTDRLVRLVEEIGLVTVAELWSRQPARSLPGALWRLYALREWVRGDPVAASLDYRAGLAYADVAGVIAGAASPPGPQELRHLADDILRGVFDGDLAVALDRASAFCRVVAAGRGAREEACSADAEPGPSPPADAPGNAWPDDLRRAAAVLAMGEDLAVAAGLWRRGSLE